MASVQSDVYIDPDSAYEEIPVSSPVYRLKETRRMRSDETHYLDHPQIGVIALVRMYAPPGADSPSESNAENIAPTAAGQPAQ